MKRVFAAVLAAVMMLCTLTACGKKAPNNLEGKSLSEIVDLIYAEKEPGIMVETMDVSIEEFQNS